ncbi:hypothetical protein [Methanocalculus sp.]|jgi:hypothetical protein|uniref:hypothetical protein n=1 Tax=Methanocalculus sp. TaxID=2004547 RepID=UPI0017EFBC8F|nr:hypothetical protein [Methanocalculus sp.]HIJ07251.1 hypothetical protein [Methanocalculus sp.]
MKDYQAVIEEDFFTIREMVKVYNLRAAFNIVLDLTRICTLFDDDDGIIIMEVLEGVFSQVGSVFDNYDVPENLKTEFASNVVEELDKLIENYKSKNQIEIYKNLRHIRTISTKLQIVQIRTGIQSNKKEHFTIPNFSNLLSR